MKIKFSTGGFLGTKTVTSGFGMDFFVLGVGSWGHVEQFLSLYYV